MLQMRQIVLLASLCLLLLSCKREGLTMRVATFNVRCDIGVDSTQNWQFRLPVIQGFFDDASVDIYGMQEVLPNQLEDLKAMLPDYQVVAAGRQDGKSEGEMVPIFFKKDRFTLLASSHFWLSQTPDSAGSMHWGTHYPRMVTWVKLRDTQNGYIFYYFNTHLSHVSPEARYQSAWLLLDKIKVLAAKAPVIVGGDFNCTALEETYQVLTTHWDGYQLLRDARHHALLPADKDAATFNGYSPDETHQVIDYIFVNGFYTTLKYAVWQIQRDNVFISDHYPVVVDLRFLLNEQMPVLESKPVNRKQFNTVVPTLEPQH